MLPGPISKNTDCLSSRGLPPCRRGLTLALAWDSGRKLDLNTSNTGSANKTKSGLRDRMQFQCLGCCGVASQRRIHEEDMAEYRIGFGACATSDRGRQGS